MSSHPCFSLEPDGAWALAIRSVQDLPLQLFNVLSGDVVASYPLLRPETEAYIAPHSIRFLRDGTHFLTGSNNEVAVFDVSRYNEGPAEIFRTGASKKKKGFFAGSSMRGIVSALDVSCDGVLAAGTFNRNIALYDHEGSGETRAVFSLNASESGRGITQLLWSPCGHYLYVAERCSDEISIYDVRNYGGQIGRLGGRAAATNQRLGMEVIESTDGHEVWAGGIDGFVRRWSSPFLGNENQTPDLEIKAHGGAVCSVTFNPCSPGLIATASGQRFFEMVVDSEACTTPSNLLETDSTERFVVHLANPDDNDAHSSVNFLPAEECVGGIKLWSF